MIFNIVAWFFKILLHDFLILLHDFLKYCCMIFLILLHDFFNIVEYYCMIVEWFLRDFFMFVEWFFHDFLKAQSRLYITKTLSLLSHSLLSLSLSLSLSLWIVLSCYSWTFKCFLVPRRMLSLLLTTSPISAAFFGLSPGLSDCFLACIWFPE